MNNLRKNQSGFTLMEMLVAIAVFVSALTAISAIFMFANKSQRVTEAVSETQTDARFAIEVMAQQVRRGSIDYASSQYGGSVASNPQDVLVLRDVSGNQVWFKRAEQNGVGAIQMSEDGVVWVDLTNPDVSVGLLKFYLSPPDDPFLDDSLENIQPKVTIVASVSSASSEGGNLLPTYIQTTISSRQYVR